MNERESFSEDMFSVLRMIAGEQPWEKGAWVNACAEFLSQDGYVTHDYKLTDKGRARLQQRKQEPND